MQPPAVNSPNPPARPIESINGTTAGGEVVVPRPLAGREVLVDTYNLRLKHGSGIKTYGLTLAEALQHLGATVSLLGDRPVPASTRRGLGEVFYYDLERGESRWKRRIGNVVRGIKRAVAPVPSTSIDNSYVVPDRLTRAVPGVERIHNVGKVYEFANQTYRRLGRMTTVRLPDGIDIWHATTLLPIRVRDAPMVTTIHDVIPLRLPYTTLDNKKFFYNIVRDAIGVSDLVLTVSECTKKDIQRFFDVPDEKIAVTYQSVPFRMYQPDRTLEDAAMKRYQLKRGEYILFVGNIEPKKNVRSIIQAVSAISGDIPLVVVGRKGWLWEEELAQAKAYFGRDVKKRFRLLDFVPRRDLHALYGCASCLVFPSLYEGFGLPPAEAFAHGCPVICSDVSSLPEVCGDAALYVDPYEPETIRDRLEELLDDTELREKLVRRGYSRLDEFSTARYAQRLMEAYSRVL